MSLIHKLTWLFQRRRREEELRDELQFHLDQEAQQRQEDGLSPHEAKWAAHRDLGNVHLLQEQVRAVWISAFWGDLLQDLRYARRMMFANKSFSALAILSLALGIGANTALYSFMDSILVHPLPVSDPDSLVILQWHAPPRWQGGVRRPTVMHSMSGTTYDDAKLGDIAGIFPYPAFELLRKNDALFSSVFAYHHARDLNVIVKGQADLATGQYVSGNYFNGLGIQPAAGRLIFPSDDDPGSSVVAVVSSAFSKKHFGDATTAAGQSILINNLPVTIAGVVPPEFFGIDPSKAPEIFLPMHATVPIEAADPFSDGPQAFFDQNYYWIEIMARQRPGVTRAQAQADLEPQFHQWVESTVTREAERTALPELVLQKGATGVEALRRQFEQPLFTLLILAGLILAIACANIANLMLSRATARKSEIAMRLSLGAGRSRLVRQLLTESIFLASLGGALGVLLSFWSVAPLTALLANGQPDFTLHAAINWRVLSVAAALSVLTGMIFGLAPALQSTRIEAWPTLKKLRTADGRSRSSLRLSRVLVVSQISISLLLLVAAGLLARTLANLQSVDLGFDRDNLLLFELDARKAGLREASIPSFYGDLQKRLSQVPGILHASLSHEPLIDAGSSLPIYVPGSPADDATRYLSIGPDFFKTMRIPILGGRGIEPSDQPGSLKVAVINELFARKNFGNQNPLGRHLILEYENHRRDMEIVGVTRNARYRGLRDSTPPVVYIPYNQGFPPPRQMVYELRTDGEPLRYASTVREIVHQVDSRVPITDIRTQSEEIDRTMNQEMILARLCTVFSVLALVIACVGLYGTVSYNAARRTSEIGIRMALGAQRGPVVWMVLREVVVLAAIGLAISLPTALATSRLIQSFLFGMSPNDPSTLTLAMLTLFTAALVAGYLPARRASRIDPMIALRHE
jgi:macrolide transport system ATP-binding/permease protein